MKGLVAAVALALVATAGAADVVAVATWDSVPLGAHGVPPGWAAQDWGRRSTHDLTIVEEDGRRALRLRSHGDRSTISRRIEGLVSLKETPILEWTWKATVLPTGGDARAAATADQAAQIYLTWPRFPALLRSRVIGYAWDTTAPAGSTFTSAKTGTVTYVIIRSGPQDLGRWLTERRNIVDDYRQIWGEEPPDPGAISLSIDSNDTRSSAESFVAEIVFRAP
jgi:Protein of unknown function (DUF3047)